MIAGRLLWKAPGAKPKGKIDLASFDFDEFGVLVLTEASPKKRASLHVIRGREALAAHDRGGIDVLACSLADFGNVLVAENRTLKRRLTDPRAFSGIGNAYSDEILHAARLSPVKLTGSLKPDEIARLHEGTIRVLKEWIDRLRMEFADRFPGVGEITAFRPEFAVHGKYGKPCPICGSPVQRIVHAENETNYCATCQTGGKVLADRSLSRLLKDDWPRTIEEWESDVGNSQ
jgi:formamidopyrimidine-DNA glycosylase